MSIHKCHFLAARAAALFILLSLCTGPAEGQRGTRGRMLSGVAYSIHAAGEPRTGSGMMAAVADPAMSYTASAVYAGARGRLDIIEGGAPPAFAKGDYVLFDSTGLVIVHPSKREFVIVSQNGGPSMDSCSR